MPSKLDYQRDNERLRRRHDELTRALSEANTTALDATQRIIDLKEELDVYRAALAEMCEIYIVSDYSSDIDVDTQKAVERQLAKFREPSDVTKELADSALGDVSAGRVISSGELLGRLSRLGQKRDEVGE